MKILHLPMKAQWYNMIEIDMNIPHVPWRYLVTTYNFKKWCYIEDLLPKGGEK